MPTHTLHHSLCVDPQTGDPIDEVIVGVYRAPRSYTGEDSAEIMCHGSPVIVGRILSALSACGFRSAQPGEFTLRAFLNGKMGLTQAEAVNEIVRSKTDQSRSLALSRLGGTIERRICSIKQHLIGILAAIEVSIDYADEDYGEGAEAGLVAPSAIEQAEVEVASLLNTYRAGRIIQDGVSVVIAGRINAGKSTLFNLLLREERSIVSEQPGTTRDYVDAAVSLNGVPVRLYDTAGLRVAVDSIEAEGMRRTEMMVRDADLTVFVVDATEGVTQVDRDFIDGSNGKLVPVWNKVDLGSVEPPEGFLPLSALSGAGLDALVTEISHAAIGGSVPEKGEAVIDSLRQKQLLERSLAALGDLKRGLIDEQPIDAVAVDLREAIDCLGEITGEVTSQDVLDRVFGEFCVGK